MTKGRQKIDYLLSVSVGKNKKERGSKWSHCRQVVLDSAIAIPSSAETILVKDFAISHLDARSVGTCVEVLRVAGEAVDDSGATHIGTVTGTGIIRALCAGVLRDSGNTICEEGDEKDREYQGAHCLKHLFYLNLIKEIIIFL